MSRSGWIRGLMATGLVMGMAVSQAVAGKGNEIPAPAADATLAATHGEESVVYSGGEAKTAEYETVSTGRTGHAESVKVVFDPSQVTYGQLLHIFFSVAHDPTELNRQGPDEGSQYRSVVFFTTSEQLRITKAYIEQLGQAHVFKHAIVTQVIPLKAFYPAEAYHQNYATLHPDSLYIRFNDAPKIESLKRDFPQEYRETLVAAK